MIDRHHKETLSAEEIAKIREVIRGKEGREACLAVGLYSCLTLYKALAGLPVSRATAVHIRLKTCTLDIAPVG